MLNCQNLTDSPNKLEQLKWGGIIIGKKNIPPWPPRMPTFGMQPYFNRIRRKMEDDLIYFQMEDTLIFFKWKTTSFFMKMEDNLLFLLKEKNLQNLDQ